MSNVNIETHVHGIAKIALVTLRFRFLFCLTLIWYHDFPESLILYCKVEFHSEMEVVEFVDFWGKLQNLEKSQRCKPCHLIPVKLNHLRLNHLGAHSQRTQS